MNNLKNNPLYNKLFHLVSKDVIAENGDYNLSGSRYITSQSFNFDFEKVTLEEVLEYEQPTNYIVDSENYNDSFKIPVLTAGKSFILGYTNEEHGIFKSPLPVIIFDDFTTATQFVNFPFKVKSSAMKILRARKDKANITFLYYLIQNIKFDSSDHKRYWISQYSKLQIPLPPLSVQEEIVEEIENYQKIIDGAKLVVENYKPKIDINPEWEMVELGSLAKNLDGKRVPITKSDRDEGKYPYYGASGIVDYVADYIFDDELLLISEDGANLLARVTPIAFSVSGKVWVNNHAHVLKFDQMKTQKFVELYLNSIPLDNYITGSAQPKLNQKALNSILIPLPDYETQKQIVERIEREQELVNANKELITIFEQKIKDRIAKVWGEELTP